MNSPCASRRFTRPQNTGFSGRKDISCSSHAGCQAGASNLGRLIDRLPINGQSGVGKADEIADPSNGSYGLHTMEGYRNEVSTLRIGQTAEDPGG